VNKPKQLTGLNQKVRSRLFLSTVGIHGQKTAGVEVEPKLSAVYQEEHGKPVLSPEMAGEPQGKLLAVRVRDCGKSESLSVMGRIGIQNLFRSKESRLPHGT